MERFLSVKLPGCSEELIIGWRLGKRCPDSENRESVWQSGPNYALIDNQ